MPLDKQQFDALLRLSYPEAVERCEPQVDRGWGMPEHYQDATDRQAALVYPLLDDHAWARLRDVDKLELTRLAGEERPLADLYNFVDYRMNQTVVSDPVSGAETRHHPGSDWQPYVGPGDTLEAASRRLYDSYDRVEANARRAAPDLARGFTPGPLPGSRRAAPDGARGQADGAGMGAAARSPHAQTGRPGNGQGWSR